jgi:DNA repair protein SbcC/Rad50
MIRIKKLLMSNYKGVKNQIVVDFQKNGNLNQILSGPNGYGKTTIFEALELCITGKFDRIQTFKNVQLKNKNRSKPFFQNTDGENVIIKLLIEKDGKEISITKHYDDQLSPKRGTTVAKDFIPEDSHSFFGTYLNNGSEDFESIEINQTNLVEQSRINELFLGNEAKVELDSIYYLFNYIQQEESIRFLKQREDDKGSSLAFLFNIEKEEREQSQLQIIVENFRAQKTTIGSEIEILESSQTEDHNLEYQRLFEPKEINFDKSEPFESLTQANGLLPSYLEELEKLIAFKSTFNCDEYKKSLIHDEINNQILSNESLLNSLLISNIYDPSLIEQLYLKNSKIIRFEKLLEIKEDQIISPERFQEFFDVNQKTKYEVLEIKITAINKDLGEIGLIISNLISANETTWAHYQDAIEKEQLTENHCPLCNSDFTNLQELTESYEKQIIRLKEFNQDKIDEKQKLYEELKQFHSVIKIKIEEYLKDNKTTSESIISILTNYSNLQSNVESIKERFLKTDFGFSEELLLSKLPNNISDLEDKRSVLKLYFQKILSNQYNYDIQKILNKELYSTYFDNDEQKLELISVDLLENKKHYLNYKLRLITNERHTFLKERFYKLTTILDRLESINNIVYSTIKDHKLEMIEKIKIPFFIYSGKILQNYQQGFGIFIDISPTGQRNNVVFKTGKDSDHDVVFHLSAGQMAVVSLAFCLSLNKVYNTNENFKLLAIDDPIQTMDNLNVHSFIELLRNEFSDYQIIMSTHDDFISRYMSYKFEKYNMKATIQNVQDLVLEQTFN